MSDPYLQPDHLPLAVFKAISIRLEERAAHSKFQALYQPYFDTIIASKSNTSTSVLEIGCGTGPIIRQLESQLQSSDTNYQPELHACDISQQFIKQAQDLTSEQSNISHIQWQLSQPNQALPYSNEQFDWVIMHTLLGHIPDPLFMLTEAKRLLKPTGKIIVFDTDFLSATFAYDDIEKGRMIDYQLMKSIAHNPDICRILPQLIQQAELNLKHSKADNLSEIGQGDFWLSSVKGLAKLMPSLNISDTNSAQAWLDYQLNAHKNQQFFASCNYYTFYINKRQ